MKIEDLIARIRAPYVGVALTDLSEFDQDVLGLCNSVANMQANQKEAALMLKATKDVYGDVVSKLVRGVASRYDD